MPPYVLPDLDYDYRGPGTPPLWGDHGRTPRQAPQGLRGQGERDSRKAGRSARGAGLLADRRPRESARLQPLWARVALDLLEEHVPEGWRCPVGRSRASHHPGLRQLRELQGAVERGRFHDHGLGLGRPHLGAAGGTSIDLPDLRPSVQPEPGGIALLVIDAWEHAYYLQYKSQKTEFFKAVWNLWNWDDVAARLEAARRVDLLVPESAGGR